jgi:glycosyltransferase involved in cell wall biosynthesis
MALKPLVTILIVVYNGERFLRESIDSALAQTFKDFEVLIVDDGSTDSTPHIIKEYEGKYEKVRSITKETNTGQPDARNIGIKEARGEFIVELDADDVIMPNTLELAVEEFEKDPTLDVVYGDLFQTDENLNVQRRMEYRDLSEDELVASLVYGNPIPHPATMVRKKCYEEAGWYDNYFLRSQDYEFWTRLAKGHKFKHVPEVFCKWRWHGENISGVDDVSKLDLSYDAEILRRILKKFSLDELFPQFAKFPKVQKEALAFGQVAFVFYQRRAFDDALKYARMSLERLKLPESYRLLGLIEEAIGETEKAQSYLAKAKTISPLQRETSEYFCRARSKLRGTKTDSLRVLFVLHNFPPYLYAGTEIYTQALGRALRSKGHEVGVFYPVQKPYLKTYDISKGYWENGIELFEVNLANRSKDFGLNLRDESFDAVFRDCLIDFCPDIIHFQHILSLPLSSFFTAKSFGVPTLLSLHDFALICQKVHLLGPGEVVCEGPESIDKCLFCFLDAIYGPQAFNVSDVERTNMKMYLEQHKAIVKEILNSAEKILAPSKFLISIFERFGFSDRLTYWPLGLRTFEVRKKYPRGQNLRFSFIGNLYKTKGIDLAIRAFRDVKNAVLNIYGAETPDRRFMEEIFSQIEMRENLNYQGGFTPFDLPEIFANTDVTIVPSIIENYPLVPRESFHAKVPVIATKIGGIPEIVKDGVNGLLFAPGDSVDLAEKVKALANGKDLLKKLRQNIKPVKTVEEEAGELEELYAELLASRVSAQYL